MTGDLRAMIREILAEEVSRLKSELAASDRAGTPQPKRHEELVRIGSDAELAGFVQRLMQLSRDSGSRREIEQGRWIFRLSHDAAPAATAEDRRLASPARPVDRPVQVESGFLSERQVDALPQGTTRLLIAKAVRLTPLARDRLRQRGIAVERKG